MERFRIAPLEFECDICKKEEGMYYLSVGDISCFEDDEGKYKFSEYYDEEGTIGFEILLSYSDIVDIRNIYNNYINSSKDKPFKNRIIKSDNGYIKLTDQYGGLYIEVGKTDSNGILIATGIEVDCEIGSMSNIQYIKNVVKKLEEEINRN